MPSNKKKGRKKKAARERKAGGGADEVRATAAAAARPANEINQPSLSIMDFLNENFGVCKHGLESSPSPGSVVDRFLKSFFSREREVMYFLHESFDEYAELWNVDANRQLAIISLLNEGANFIMSRDIQAAREVATGIFFMEKHDGKSRNLQRLLMNVEVVAKIKNLCSVTEIIRFYKRRIPCGCLEDVYKEEKKKSGAPIGYCESCCRHVARSTLMACSQCKFLHYCSKECQINHWPEHKLECKAISASRQTGKLMKMEEIRERFEKGERVDHEECAAAVKEMWESLPDSKKTILGELLGKGEGADMLHEIGAGMKFK